MRGSVPISFIAQSGCDSSGGRAPSTGHRCLALFSRDTAALISRATCLGLLLSFATVREHAPQVLDRDGIEHRIPSCDAVDYFAKALRGDPANDASEEPAAPPEVIEDLHRAVFEENKPVAVLRRTFNPILNPKPEGAAELETLQKGHALARKLTHVLPELEGLSEPARERVAEALDILRNELEELIPEARDRIERARKAS